MTAHKMKVGLCLLVALYLTGCSSVSPTPRIDSPTPPALTATAPALLRRSPTPTLIQIPSPTVTRAATHSPAPTLIQQTSVAPTLIFPPSIITFTFAPARLNPGDSVTLTWEVIGAAQVTVYRVLDYRLTLPAYEVPLTGSQVFTTYATERNFASFVLFASIGDQQVQAGVTIPIRCPDTWFFNHPPVECPTAALNTNFVAQAFEQGQMLWAESSDRIYILYAGGNRWSATHNRWFDGMPESDPTLIPPEGYYQPVRGFGVAWRDEQALAGHRVRDQLGWAIQPEYAWGAGAVQCTAATKYSTCYLGGPGSLIYLLKPEGSGWEIWRGPTP